MSIVRRLLALSLLVIGPLAAQADFFPLAVWYGGGKARAPMLERDPAAKREIWRKDLRQIRALGFNTIRCWIDWASGEPQAGRYHFETLDVLMDLAQEEGLKVIVQVYMDSAPAWVGRAHPDSRFVSSNGAVIEPESSPGYCRDHPAVRAADVAFYRALAERARQHPALFGWDLWSEPHVINWATPTFLPNPEFCFCPHTLRRFRTWLKKRYGTVDNLNAAWYRHFNTWDEIEPNRLSTILSFADYIDWKAFIADKLGEDLGERYQAVKSAAPQHVVTSHAAGVGLFASPHWWEGQSDDWTMTPQVDFYGTSFYPKHSAFVDRDTEWRAALLDFTRSFGFGAGRKQGFWIGELQSGFGTIAVNVSPTVTPEDLRIWTWSAVARGAKAINYYAWYPMSTGYESGGFGMIDLDGTVTERAKEAGSIAKLIDEHHALFAGARPAPAEVAIVYNPLSHFVGGRQRQAAYGGPQGEVAGIERDSLLGIHRALFPTNLPVDYVHAAHLTAASLGAYKLVYFPYPLMIPESVAAPLTEYVRNGGTLVTEARLGWNTERGQAAEIVPGAGLHNLMGCRETAIQTAPKGRTTILWNGAALPARWFQEVLEPLRSDAEVAARYEDGSAAAVRSRFGKGKTLMLGSYVSAAYQTAPDPAAARFFRDLVDWAGIRYPVTATGGVEVRLLDSGRRRLMVVLNHQTKPIVSRIDISGTWTDLSGQRVELGSFGVNARSVRVVATSRPE